MIKTSGWKGPIKSSIQKARQGTIEDAELKNNNTNYQYVITFLLILLEARNTHTHTHTHTHVYIYLGKERYVQYNNKEVHRSIQDVYLHLKKRPQKRSHNKASLNLKEIPPIYKINLRHRSFSYVHANPS